jgi:hypothetical protein
MSELMLRPLLRSWTHCSHRCGSAPRCFRPGALYEMTSQAFLQAAVVAYAIRHPSHSLD